MAFGSLMRLRDWLRGKPSYRYNPHAPENRRAPAEQPIPHHQPAPPPRRGWGLPVPSWWAYRRNRKLAERRMPPEDPFFEAEGGEHE